MALLLSFSVVACTAKNGQQETEPASSGSEPVSEAPTSAVTEPAEEETTLPVTTEPLAEKRGENDPFTVVDMGGREVSFDGAIKKAFAANPMGIILIETMDFDKLGGYSSKLSEAQKEYIPEKYWDLPDLGAWSTATPTANIEELVKADIDVIIVIQQMTEKVKQMAENIQSQTGIPTVLVSSDLDQLAESYHVMGELFDDEERATILADYFTTELNELAALIGQVPEADRYSVYYAEGTDALETDPAGSFHTQVFDFLGLKNVAEVAENTTNGFVGQSQVSLEQVIAWDPDYIIRNASGTGSSENVSVKDMLAADEWAGLRAVQNGNVYATPALPYNWIDRPPSVIRLIGIKWLANLMYPDVFQYDIYAEAQEFFSLFLNIDLSNEQLDKILANSK